MNAVKSRYCDGDKTGVDTDDDDCLDKLDDQCQMNDGGGGCCSNPCHPNYLGSQGLTSPERLHLLVMRIGHRDHYRDPKQMSIENDEWYFC